MVIILEANIHSNNLGVPVVIKIPFKQQFYQLQLFVRLKRPTLSSTNNFY